MKAFLKSLFSTVSILSLAFPCQAHDQTPMDIAKALNSAFSAVAAGSFDKVVVVETSRDVPATPDISKDEKWRDFLENLGIQEIPNLPESFRSGSGSGIIFRPDGYIMTNYHVVESADILHVRFRDGRRLKAAITGFDSMSDIAILKVEADNLDAAVFANSDQVSPGEFAIAVGAPFDLDYSVTVGHVSAKGRYQVMDDPSKDQDFIQTDAGINPGNSGGPLLNLEGQVIGVNTLIKGLGTGIGFAVSSNQASAIGAQIIQTGRFVRPWLGISILTLRDAPAIQTQFPSLKDGVFVHDIADDGPAHKAGIQIGDVIVRLEKQPVKTSQELKNQMRTKPLDVPVRLRVIRLEKGKEKSLTYSVIPRAWESAAHESPVDTLSFLGMRVESVEGRAQVVDIERGSLADTYDLRKKDIIVELDDQKIPDYTDYQRAIFAADPMEGVTIRLERDGHLIERILKDAGE